MASTNDWKKFVKNSKVVMAIANNNYQFTLVDIDVGHQNCSVVFSTSNFGSTMNSGKCPVPEPQKVAELHQEMSYTRTSKSC